MPSIPHPWINVVCSKRTTWGSKTQHWVLGGGVGYTGGGHRFVHCSKRDHFKEVSQHFFSSLWATVISKAWCDSNRDLFRFLDQKQDKRRLCSQGDRLSSRNAIQIHLFTLCKGIQDSLHAVDSGFHAVDSGIQVLNSSLCQWNLDCGFQSLVGFRTPWSVFWIPKLRIPDSTSKNFTDSGIWIPLHGASFTLYLNDCSSWVSLWIPRFFCFPF